MKLPRSEEPLLFLRMHVAQAQLESGAVAECKAAVSDGRDALERMHHVDPAVSASVFYVRAHSHTCVCGRAGGNGGGRLAGHRNVVPRRSASRSHCPSALPPPPAGG